MQSVILYRKMNLRAEARLPASGKEARFTEFR